MNEASTYLLGLAQRLTGIYLAHTDPSAVMLTGSAAEGQSDFYSDLDLIIYYPALPAEEALAAAQSQIQPEALQRVGDRAEGEFAEFYTFDGVECQVAHTTIAAWEAQIASVLEGLDVSSPIQKALEGTLHCLPLHGEVLIRQWQTRIRAYPDALAQAMVERYLKFFPVWSIQPRFLTRDATLWWYQVLVESEQNILGVLAGLNRLYYTTFQFKRAGKFTGQMRLAPENLAARLENLFHLEPPVASEALEALVRETITLVESHMPEVDTSAVRHRLGRRQQAWKPVEKGAKR